MARRRRSIRDGQKGIGDFAAYAERLQIADLIHERGPTTVAAFMDLALYHPQLGYYARVARRTGQTGDFFTSVDVGPLFGDLIADQVAEMARFVASTPFDLVEVGAGDGRLAADVLSALRHRHPDVYGRTRLYLVEASPVARAAQPGSLAGMTDHLVASSESMPDTFTGVLLANELLDAMPVHQVVMRADGLREIYVVSDGRMLATREGPPSSAALGACLTRQGVHLEPGWRAEINLRAQEWMREVGRRLAMGFIIVIDYGHDAQELYSASHASGTLTSYARHVASDPSSNLPGWLDRPGYRDITSHVDFTSVRAAAEEEGMVTLGWLDQTYFLLGLAARELPAVTRDLKERLALKTLLMPGGLGSTHKVLLLGKNVGTPALSGCSYRMRIT